MSKVEWLRCPRCGGKTRTMVREHTVLEDFPLFCPKCRYECIVRFREGKMEEVAADVYSSINSSRSKKGLSTC